MADPIIPATPAHPPPDAEVQLPKESFQFSEWDLNPDLDDEDKDESEATTEPVKSKNRNGESRNQYYRSEQNFVFFLWTIPFDEAMEQLVSEFLHSRLKEPLTLSQESKLIAFLDNELLQVQRRFIKNQSDSCDTYPITQLLSDVKDIIDIIWCLIDLHTPLFGQEEYFIRILGDLEDWMSFYDLPVLDVHKPENITSLKELFLFFQALDTRISFLMDGYNVDDITCKLSPTEIVRLGPVANRVRFEILKKMERSRTNLLLKRNKNEGKTIDFMNVVELEVGRLLEGIIERL